MRFFLSAALFLAALFLPALPAAALTEAPTLEAAQSLARKGDCFIYLELTGTDWCTACIHHRSTILDSDTFGQAMGDKLVLVQLDYPRKPELVAQISPAQWKEREALLASYKIEGLPAAILLDADGLPFEVIPATRRTPADYLPLVEAGLARLAARNAVLAEAAPLQGLDRARALIKALDALPEVCRDKYTSLAEEIQALDPEHSLGFRNLARESQLRVEQMERLQTLTSGFVGKWSPEELRTNLRELDAFLADPELVPETRQLALRAKGDTYAFLRELDSMCQAYKEAMEAAPETRLGHTLKKNLEIYAQRQKETEGK